MSGANEKDGKDVGSLRCSGSAVDQAWLDRKGFRLTNGAFVLDYTDADGDPAIVEYVIGDDSACVSPPHEPWVAAPFRTQDVAERLLTALGVQ